ncbi:2,4-dihydroxyhept-2-ene-1,7-dioic acid aldolase [Humibacillus sp. DSM 29435]|uniref:HpcH/HpaI aldolase family protein n=1 Tax=Humibacillus sp. DSM 29435 TaxID=1869167 RepID=UPI0008729EDD|nr:aldolase/citrate lyase family protein [Humibacillus sp. DSM 29435]OFE17335.1 2,4-dihydroxyhept-2-ene-1,7-dioic acid aldolase [Humibacillus sp. DSM 29435]
MRGNRVKELIDGGGFVVNAWVSCDSPYVAEVLSHAGYDAVTIDHQHGMFGLDRVITLLQAVSSGPAMPMVRCSHLDLAEIGKLLDGGAYGVICPSVDTAEQCTELVAACRYPPVGRRSFGPSRGLLYGGPDYVEHANDTVQVWAMIESREALENLEEIVAVPGLDGVYVGPNDLALSLGVAPATSPIAAEVREALSRVLEIGHAAGVAVGAYCADAQMAAELVGEGYDLVTPGNDVVLLREGAAQRLAITRGKRSSGAAHAGY